MDKRGYTFTITIIAISMVLISLLIFYTRTSTTKIEDTSTRITVGKVHDFVEDVKGGLRRATGICARRAAVYVVNEVKEHAIAADPDFLDNYTYQACTDFDYAAVPDSVSGSPAAVVELMVCGTLDGVAVDAMSGNTLEDWRARIEEKGRQLDLVTNVSIKSVDVPLYDVWHLAAIVYIDLEVSDGTNTSSYRGYDVPVLSMVSIVGLEDPLYQAGTNDPRVPSMFHPCNLTFFREMVGSGGKGSGVGGGLVSYVANLSVVGQKNSINSSNGTVVESRGVDVFIGTGDTLFVINLNASDALGVR
ncbi:MAG: hypothetical protein U9Q22_07420, partial [Candidatus Altiarchaeota archaeon]|nr:hypothetical protein [Candidatus Altiarchaeota archaeon]